MSVSFKFQSEKTSSGRFIIALDSSPLVVITEFEPSGESNLLRLYRPSCLSSESEVVKTYTAKRALLKSSPQVGSIIKLRLSITCTSGWFFTTSSSLTVCTAPVSIARIGIPCSTDLRIDSCTLGGTDLKVSVSSAVSNCIVSCS